MLNQSWIFVLLALWPIAAVGYFAIRRWPQTKSLVLQSTSGKIKQQQTLVCSTLEAGGLPLDVDVCVQGTVQPGAAGILHSPDGWIECVWWKNIIESGDSNHRTREITTSPEIFYVHDQQGSIAVMPQGIQFAFELDHTNTGLTKTVREWVLEPGQQVQIIAQIGQNPDGLRFLYQSNSGKSAVIGTLREKRLFQKVQNRRIWMMVALAAAAAAFVFQSSISSIFAAGQ